MTGCCCDDCIEMDSVVQTLVRKVEDLENRLQRIESHKNVCEHPKVDEDWVYNGENEVRILSCRVCGEEWEH